MGHLVDEERDNESGDNHKYPAYAAQHVGILVSQTACCLVDVRHEEAHHRSHKVPCKVYGSQEGNSLHGDAVGEQQLDIVEDAALLLFCLLGRKLRTLFQLTLQVPCYEGHNKEGEEHYARAEHLDGSLSSIGTYDSMSQRLYRGVEIATRRKQHAEEQDEHRTQSPRHLRDTDVAASVVDFRTLRDIRP